MAIHTMLSPTLSRLILSLLIISMLFGCATNHGYGVIIAEQKESNPATQKNYIKDRTKQHAKDLGIAGATGGGISLGSFAFWYGFMEVGLGSALTGTAVLGSAGAATFGLAGAAAGGAAGYILEKSKARSTLYQYSVKSLDDASKIYTIKQYWPAIPLNAKVKVLERNGTMFMRKN